MMQRIVVACLFTVAIAGQAPGFTTPPGGGPGGQQEQLETVADIADQIAQAVKDGNPPNPPADPDGGATSERSSKAFRKALDADHVVVFEWPYPTPVGRTPPYAMTTPDTWTPPSDWTASPVRRGQYWRGLTPWQFICFNVTFLGSHCGCAIAVVAMHEGWRTNQQDDLSVAGPPPANQSEAQEAARLQRQQRGAKNGQGLAVHDLKNIRAAKDLAACADPLCLKQLDAMEATARSFLTGFNDYAAGLGVPPVSAPY